MLVKIEERINSLEQATVILEDHVNQHALRMEVKPLEFITEQIEHFKREIRIRRDFPIFKQL